MNKKFLIRHIGNMGDMIFFVPPVLATLKRKYPDCHITFVTAWGFKEKVRRFPYFYAQEFWGNRNQAGFCINLMLTNPHIDQLIHWHDSQTSLDGGICQEDGVNLPTWSREYYMQQKQSQFYDGIYELDFGIGLADNPLVKMYEAIGLPEESYSKYEIYLTESDLEVARSVMENFPAPRIVLLEGIEGITTRGWDPGKLEKLENAIKNQYGITPFWFGGRHERYFQGRLLTLRENIATLTLCQAAIGVMSGPLHFAAAVGLPTITLFGDQPLHRAAPAFFLNQYIENNRQKHRTLMGPTNPDMKFLKADTTLSNLTGQEARTQGFQNWLSPGQQATKSCISVLTVPEIMTVLADIIG